MKTTPVAMALLWAMAGPGNAPAQAEGQSIDPSKKIILMAGGHRRPDTLLRDLERMEKLGAFDGIAVYPPLALHGARKDVIGRLFRTERHDIEDFGQAIADLQAVRAKATRFKHNFLLAYLTTGIFSIDPPRLVRPGIRRGRAQLEGRRRVLQAQWSDGDHVRRRGLLRRRSVDLPGHRAQVPRYEERRGVRGPGFPARGADHARHQRGVPRHQDPLPPRSRRGARRSAG